MKVLSCAVALFVFIMSQAVMASSISINEEDCSAITKGNVNVCFHNTTSGNLGDYQLLETIIHQDGSSDQSILNLAALQTHFFTVVSTSSDELSKHKVASIWYAVIRGDANTYNTVPGCITEITSVATSKQLLTIAQGKNNLYCK